MCFSARDGVIAVARLIIYLEILFYCVKLDSEVSRPPATVEGVLVSTCVRLCMSESMQILKLSRLEAKEVSTTINF